MKIKRLISLVTMFVFLMASAMLIDDAFARGGSFGGGGGRSFGGGGRSFSGGGSRSSGSSGWGRSSSPKASPKVTPKSNQSVNKASKPNSNTTKKSMQSNADKKISKAQQQKKSATFNRRQKAEQAKFSKKDTNRSVSADTYKSNPIYQRARNSGYNRGNYYARRDSFYGGRGYSAPGYYYNSYSSFGMWDAMFMWMMLDSMNDRMYYNHMSDPGFKQWRSEADRLSAENAELKAKLAQLDTKVATLDGTPKDANYMPKDVPVDVALASDVMETAAPVAPVEPAHKFPWGTVIGIGSAVVVVIIVFALI